MSGWSQTDIDIEMEIKEEFCAIFESIKSEDEKKADIKPATLPVKLCAMPYNDMVNIFNSFEITKDILEKIEYSLPITVKQTDTLPTQICRFCLVELERCHRFRKSVAEANELLLAFEKLACITSEETKKNYYYSPLHNAQLGSTEYDNVDGPSETNSDMEINDNESTIIPKDVQTAIRLRRCSVVLSILKTCSKDKSGAEYGEKSSSNTENRSADSTAEVLDVERKASENDEENTCDSGVNTKNPDDFALARSRNQLLKCDTCAKTFKWKSHLTRHYKMHTNKELGSHKCKMCAKTFKWKSDLVQHGKIHTGKGLHSCQYCEKAFTKKHIKDVHHRIHTNERPFKCPDCKKSFMQQAHLKRHAIIHSEKRNYRCPLCDKSFKTLDGNNNHMKLFHLNNRPWRCAHCGKTFGRKWSLRIHLETCKYQSD